MADVEVIELLKKLVALPSVNPEHTDDASIANEYRVADFFAGYLAERGFRIEWDRMTPERGSVLASYGPEQPLHTLLLEAHLDTVGVADMVIPPFEPRVENGRLYGRGSCDTKGPMAAAMTALCPRVLDSLAEAGVRVLYIGAFGEEKGNVGAERLVESGVGAHSAIILEPTDLSIVYAHKGALWFEVLVTGEAAHGSDPDRGMNAIFAMAKVLQWLQTRTAQAQEEWNNPALGGPTLNVGRIDGGIAMNIVAHRCRIEVDRRTVPGEDHEAILSEVRAMLSDLQVDGEIRSFEVNVLKAGTPFQTAQDSVLVRGVQEVLVEGGCEPRLATAAWYSDAGAFARTCNEIIVFGPGSIHQAHTVDEYIEIDQLMKGEELLTRYFEWLSGHVHTFGAANSG